MACWGNLDVIRVFNLGGLGSVVGACLVDACIRVNSLELNKVLLEVEEGFELPATVATIAGGVAINKLLFRERQEVSGSDLVSTFHRRNSGEGPA